MVREGLRLRVGGKADLAGRAAERERDELARGLARLNVLRHARAVREVRAGEGALVPLVAGLEKGRGLEVCCAREEGEGKVTNVREVDDRLASCAAEDVQECDREDVYSAVLAI